MKEIPTQIIPIGKIEPNKGQIEGLPKNPRLIRDERFNKLKKSIEDNPEMLYMRELLVYPHEGKYVVIGGNMRLMAMKDLGYTDAPCKVIPEGTTVEQLKAYTIKDNAAFGEWDYDLLKNEWDEVELDEWCLDIPSTTDTTDTNEPSQAAEAHEDDFDPDAHYETKVKAGKVWQLGEHRLMCGDSTDAECFAKLMNGERADIAFTSPPYNMQATNIAKAFDSDKVKDSYGIKEGTYNEFSDALSNEDYAKLLNGALDCCLAHSDEVLFNIGILAASKNGIIDMMAAHKDKFSDILVWNKNQCMPLCLPTQIHLLGHVCELIFCFSNAGTRAFSHSQWELGRMHNRIDVGKQNANEYSKIHHATFPVELPGYIIKWFTEKSVLDCFGGTGTTMIAAEQLGRKCYMMELDPHYCDVIIARWEKLTGQKAKLITNTKTTEPCQQNTTP